MRALKIVFAAVLVAVAVTAGFVVVALLAGVAILFLAGRALVIRLRGSAAGPSAPRAAPRRKPAAGGEVIDITATEVPNDRLR